MGIIFKILFIQQFLIGITFKNSEKLRINYGCSTPKNVSPTYASSSQSHPFDELNVSAIYAM